jgi:hypothetical protein
MTRDGPAAADVASNGGNANYGDIQSTYMYMYF